MSSPKIVSTKHGLALSAREFMLRFIFTFSKLQLSKSFTTHDKGRILTVEFMPPKMLRACK